MIKNYVLGDEPPNNPKSIVLNCKDHGNQGFELTETKRAYRCPAGTTSKCLTMYFVNEINKGTGAPISD